MFALLVVLSGELILLVSVLWIRKLSVWPGDLFRLFFELFSVLALSEFLRLSSSFRNLLLCRLLVVLYAKYIWEWTLDATSGEKRDAISSLSCRSCCSMAIILLSALYFRSYYLFVPHALQIWLNIAIFSFKSIRTLLKQLMIIWFFILISVTYQVYLLFKLL